LDRQNSRYLIMLGLGWTQSLLIVLTQPF